MMSEEGEAVSAGERTGEAVMGVSTIQAQT
jgi:hypothetical protein